MWIEEIKAIKEFCDKNKIPIVTPNPLNNYGIVLDNFGFNSVISDLVE